MLIYDNQFGFSSLNEESLGDNSFLWYYQMDLLLESIIPFWYIWTWHSYWMQDNDISNSSLKPSNQGKVLSFTAWILRFTLNFKVFFCEQLTWTTHVNIMFAFGKELSIEKLNVFRNSNENIIEYVLL